MTQDQQEIQPEQQQKNSGRLVAGLIMMSVGVLLALGLTDLLDPFHMSTSHFWPMILIAIGVGFLASASDTEGRRRGLFIMTVGIWMLLTTLHVFGLEWRNSWPVLLLLLGTLNLFAPRRGCVRILPITDISKVPAALAGDKARDDRSSAFWLFVVGLWGLAVTHHLWGFTYGNSWPIFLVAGGASMVWEGLRRKKRASASDSGLAMSAQSPQQDRPKNVLPTNNDAVDSAADQGDNDGQK